jgi:hypothetical protein
MAALIREVRLKDKPEVTMFASAMGAPVDPGACRHELSHVVQDAGEVSAAVLAWAMDSGGLRLEVASSDVQDTLTGRRLLDISLMKARAEGASLVRVAHWPSGSSDAMWASAEWLSRLDTIEHPRHRVPAPNHPAAARVDLAPLLPPPEPRESSEAPCEPAETSDPEAEPG